MQLAYALSLYLITHLPYKALFMLRKEEEGNVSLSL